MRTRLALVRVEKLLLERLEKLEPLVRAGDANAWPEFAQVVAALSALASASTPENGGAMLTTKQLAERMGISAGTLLRYKRNGEIRPAISAGKFVRWSGREVMTPRKGTRRVGSRKPDGNPAGSAS